MCKESLQNENLNIMEHVTLIDRRGIYLIAEGLALCGHLRTDLVVLNLAPVNSCSGDW